MEIIKIRDDFIKLGQALKLAGLVESGVDAKIEETISPEEVQEGQVKLNGVVEVQRGKKVHPGDVIEYGGQQVRVEN
jgi:ribosome-associated protein